MGSNGDEARNDGAGSVKEEKINVSVRMRPLNSKEIERNEHSDWDVIKNTTIIFKNNLPDRSMPPSAYTYDRVFGCNCDTRKVYEEGAKEVALSAVSGINSSIFAYGQTSSGKTYTMRGITEYFVDDIYDYIGKHEEREFHLKFSAMEIYNEAVKDLLSSDDTHLRLLDDPDRGTVVEKLTEETLRDKSHLKELLAICEVQRQIGETYLNEASSRSHQILKLTVESLAKQFRASTLAATVNFIDLAGSERASQTLSAGTRLKEGSHINRSLLTLGTVIRKLSKGRNAHVPYRDSKLTRILQNSLGGNARTAIICTMSTARSHIEQSRNTLLFASCAKEVATSARVNVVMSDKALVKHLKSELARLEDELRYVGSVHKTTEANELKEKDAKIIKMEKEIMQLIQQRDLAQLQLNDLLGSVTDDQSSLRLGEYEQYFVRHVRNHSDDVHSLRHWEESSEVSAQLTPNSQAFRQWDEYAQLPVYRVGTSEDESSMSEASGICYQSPEFGISKLRISSHVSSNYDANPPPSLPLNSSYALEIASKTSEDQCKEVRCIEASDSSNKDEFSLLLSEYCDSLIPHFLNADVKEDHESSLCSLGKDLAVFRASSASGTEAETPLPRLKKSEICFDKMVWLPETSLLDEDVKFQDTGAGLKAQRTGACEHKLGARHSSKTSSEKGIPTMSNFVQELKELAQDQYQKQLSKKLETLQSIEHCNEVKIRKDAPTSELTSVLPLEFERLQREITELWDTCNVSLIHRTYFFLLFIGGEPADSVYMEVERRRLSFLKKKLPRDCKKCQTLSSSIKNLRHERDMLHRRMLKRLSLKEREELYLKWGIELRSKQRRMQVIQLLWTDAKDMEHVRESALLVAKLIGLVEPEQALKEMFGFTFTPQKTHRRSFSWNRISSFRSAQ